MEKEEEEEADFVFEPEEDETSRKARRKRLTRERRQLCVRGIKQMQCDLVEDLARNLILYASEKDLNVITVEDMEVNARRVRGFSHILHLLDQE